MITKSQILYTSILSSILGGGGLGYYFLSGNNASPEAQSQEALNSEDFTTITNDSTQTIQKQAAVTESENHHYHEREINIKFKDGDGWITKSGAAEKYPAWKTQNPEWIAQAEALKKTDPVYYRHHYDNPFHKQIDLESAKEKINVLMDYTLMMSYSAGCASGWGTGWILDYVLPEGNQTYPTKFFIASAGHVVNGYKWDENNPYQQVLSISEKDVKPNVGKDCFRDGKWGWVNLIKEKIKSHENDDFDKSKWALSKQRHKDKDHMLHVRDQYDVSKYKGRTDDVDLDYWKFSLPTKPKLVYFPHNYLGKDKQEHLADFVIFEVDFGDENVARLFTRNFYGKYDREKGTHKDKALNFFSEPLSKTYTSQQLLENDVQFWMAGYPGVGHSHKASTNYNINRKSASRLIYKGVRGEDDRLLLGHMRAVGGNWNWGGSVARTVGYLYSFNDPEVEHGASGSLITMGDKNVVGVYSYISGDRDIGGATPLRNAQIKDKDGKVIFEAYDFIEGVAGQNGSYKEQIQKYVLKNGKQTSLSKLRGWTAVN